MSASCYQPWSLVFIDQPWGLLQRLLQWLASLSTAYQMSPEISCATFLLLGATFFPGSDIDYICTVQHFPSTKASKWRAIGVWRTQGAWEGSDSCSKKFLRRLTSLNSHPILMCKWILREQVLGFYRHCERHFSHRWDVAFASYLSLSAWLILAQVPNLSNAETL